MAADNVYDEDQEYLIEARDTISELEDLKDKLEEIKLLQKKNKRAIVREERATGDEISATLKKRKEQIAASHDFHLLNDLFICSTYFAYSKNPESADLL